MQLVKVILLIQQADVTATLPGSASRDEIRFIDSSVTADTHNITLEE